MLPVNLDQNIQMSDKTNTFGFYPVAVEIHQPDRKLEELLADLSAATPWGNRKMAAKRLGSMHNPAALPGLLAALPVDPFWMVRCAIIQALEMIGDPAAIPVLQATAGNDAFQVVRSHAAKAILRLS